MPSAEPGPGEPSGDRTPPAAGTAPGVATTGSAVRTSGLRKEFGGRKVAVAGIDLDVPRGAIYGFLGPNGSGKTTTIRMLLGLIVPTAGTIEVLGSEIPRHATTVLPRVGSLVEGPAFHPYLSGRANLRRLDAVDRTADPATAAVRIDTALDRVGLAQVAGQRFRAYSLGMKQRLGIAAALLQPRELLVLDEPTNGLDPQGTREMRHLIADLAADGTTVVVSSHLISEIEQICSHVGVMASGQLLAQGPIESIRSGARARVRVDTAEPERAAAVLTELGLSEVDHRPGRVSAVRDVEQPADRIVVALVEAGVPVTGFSATGGLEDEFIALTGEGFDVA